MARYTMIFLVLLAAACAFGDTAADFETWKEWVRHEVNGTKLPPGVPRHAYTLDFAMPGAEPLESATYLVSHPKLGRFHLFLNEQRPPKDSTARFCGAVIN